MRTQSIYNANTNFAVFSLKESLCFLLLLMPLALADENIHLEITNFNHLEVEVSCTCECDWNMTDFYYEVWKSEKACLYQNTQGCKWHNKNDCGFTCKDSENPKNLKFTARLDGACDEVISVSCQIGDIYTNDPKLKLDKSIDVTAQSDPPVISVNGGKRVEASYNPVPITCTITNICYKTKLSILGKVALKHINVTHIKQFSRYTTTALSMAIFDEAGNQTISCKETGKDEIFSRNTTLVVYPSNKVDWPKPAVVEDSFVYIAFALIPVSIIFLISTIILAVCYGKLKKNRASDQGYEKVPLQDAAAEAVNTDLISNDSGYGKKEEEVQTDRHYGKKEEEVQTESGYGKKEEEVQTDSGYGKREEVQTDNFEDETNDSLLWKCANIFLKAETFHPGAIETLTGLVKVGANPFTLYSGKTVFTAFLEECHFHNQESCISSALKFFKEVLSTEDISCADEGTLNDVVKSFPRAILESDSNLQPLEEVLVKICFRVIMTNSALRNHVDKERRTPLHNLMASLSTDDIWHKAKLLPGSKNLLDLMLKLITTRNIKLKDKDEVTPYSWLSLWRESKTFVNVADTPKIKEIIQLLDQRGDKNDHQGREFLRKMQKKKNIMKLQNAICGLWIKTNEKIGKKISLFIESGQNPRKVHEADIENTSYLQECPPHKGYFAVISSQSFMNHNFCIYLMSILRQLACGTLRNKSAFVLVVVDKDAVSLLDDAQDKTIHWPINLLDIPRVDVNSQLDDDLLNQVASKLQGPQLNPGHSTSNGNVGIGLAWGVFQYNFAFMLSGIRERIKKSAANKIHANKMSMYYIIIIPESSEVDLKIQEHGIPKTNIVGNLDIANRIDRSGWSPYRLKELVFEIANTKGEKFYCCATYIRHHAALKYMFESGELTMEEMKKQHRLFTDTLKSILSHPLYQNHALVFCCQDYDGLPDKLCDLMTKQVVEEPLSFETNPRNQVTRVAEGLAWSYYRRYVNDLGPGLAKAIKETELYKKKKMPAKYFILLPYSCVIHYNVNDAEKEHIRKSDRKLKGHEKVIPIYEISSPRLSTRESYFACVAYRVEAGLLREMATGKLAALTPVQRAAELRIFYEVLNYLFTRPSAPECCHVIRLIYFDDDENCGRKLSEILTEEIKESLQEEGRK